MQVLLNFGEKGKGYILQAMPSERISVRGHVGKTLGGYFRMIRRDMREGATYVAEKACVLVVNGFMNGSQWGKTNIVYGVTLVQPKETISLGQYFLSPRMAEFLTKEKHKPIYVPESLAYMPVYEDSRIVAQPQIKSLARHTQGWVVSQELISQVVGVEPDLTLVQPTQLYSAVVGEK